MMVGDLRVVCFFLTFLWVMLLSSEMELSLPSKLNTRNPRTFKY